MNPTLTYTQRLMRPLFRTPNTGDWQNRHGAALIAPSSQERPLVSLLHGWADYADQHRRRHDSGIGEDYVLGPQWAAMGVALLALLNGDLGRLDGGTLDGFIRDTLAAEGYDADTL